MGSRYGGLKQLDPMGPSGETVLDYAVYDAMRAGFGRIVFVIRRDIERPFRETVGRRYAGHIELDYAFQELNDLPEGHAVPPGRTKPWGTAHALRAARHVVDCPFAVINADDFYGADAYRVLAGYFKQCESASQEPLCMVGYPLSHTLSEHGSVNRGICTGRDGKLESVGEVTEIQRAPDGRIRGLDSDGRLIDIEPEVPVSMNFWGFSPAIFSGLEAHFLAFLKERGNETKAECYIPSFVDTLIRAGTHECDLLTTSADWFGVTYPADKPHVQKQLKALTDARLYPSPLMT